MSVTLVLPEDLAKQQAPVKLVLPGQQAQPPTAPTLAPAAAQAQPPQQPGYISQAWDALKRSVTSPATVQGGAGIPAAQPGDPTEQDYQAASAMPSGPEKDAKLADLNTRQRAANQRLTEGYQPTKQPLVDVSQFVPAGHPVAQGVAEAASGLTSPENLALMVGSGGLGALAQTEEGAAKLGRLVSGGFSLQMLKGLYDESKEFRTAADAGDEDAMKRIAGRMAVGATGVILGGEHAIRGEAIAPKPEEIDKAGTVDLNKTDISKAPPAPEVKLVLPHEQPQLPRGPIVTPPPIENRLADAEQQLADVHHAFISAVDHDSRQAALERGRALLPEVEKLRQEAKENPTAPPAKEEAKTEKPPTAAAKAAAEAAERVKAAGAPEGTPPKIVRQIQSLERRASAAFRQTAGRNAGKWQVEYETLAKSAAKLREEYNWPKPAKEEGATEAPKPAPREGAPSMGGGGEGENTKLVLPGEPGNEAKPDKVAEILKPDTSTPEKVRAAEAARQRQAGESPKQYYRQLDDNEKTIVNTFVSDYKNMDWHGQQDADDAYNFHRPEWSGLPIEEKIARLYRINEPAIREAVGNSREEILAHANALEAEEPELAKDLRDLANGNTSKFFAVHDVANRLKERLPNDADQAGLTEALDDYVREPGADEEELGAPSGERAVEGVGEAPVPPGEREVAAESSADELKKAITEGEQLIRYGKEGSGEKLTDEEIAATEAGIKTAREKLAKIEQPPEFLSRKAAELAAGIKFSDENMRDALDREISNDKALLRQNPTDEEREGLEARIKENQERLDAIRNPKRDEGMLGRGTVLFSGVDPTMVVSAFRAIKKTWADVSEGLIQHVLRTGRPHAEIEALDPKLASSIRQYERAPLYFRTKAQDLVRNVVGDLDRKQERLFTLLADEDARENLRLNHNDEYREGMADPKIQEALARYKPLEEQLTKAREILGGQTLDRDYLKRVYAEHTSGIGARRGGEGEKSAPTAFDKVITPQRTDKYSREASAEYHYKEGLHEFGPAFATKYVGTMLKLSEHATAARFLSKATKLEPGDALPAKIVYNGETFYRADVVRAIKEAKPGKESEEIARDLGVRQLPKPKDAKAYDVYDPEAGKRRAADAPEPARFLGPKEIVGSLHGMNEQSLQPGNFIQRFLREQKIGIGFGVPHVFNIMRRISQSFPGGAGNPINWVRAARALTDKELKARSLEGTNDPQFDDLLRWGGMSPHQVESYKSYIGGNLNPANWLRMSAKVGHDYLFGAGGLDSRARLYVADLIRSQEPGMTSERAAELVNDQLGRYNRSTWTDLQKRVGHYALFPGWDFSSMNWVLRHPLRTTVPPMILTMLANEAINYEHGNKDRDRFDPFNVHIGSHSYGLGLMSEPLGRRVMAPVGRGLEEWMKGGTRRQIITAGAKQLPSVAGAIPSMVSPYYRAIPELAMGKTTGGQDIVGQGDWTRPGRILPNKGLEDEAEHVAGALFPQAEPVGTGRQNWFEDLLSNFGINRQKEKPARPPLPEHVQDAFNTRDELRQIQAQARTVQEDKDLTADERKEALDDLRAQFKDAMQRYQKLANQ